MILSRKKLVLGAVLMSIAPSFFGFSSALVSAEEQYASKQRATVAKAHMSRARALLVEALEEFEESKKYARPDLLIDSEDWRLRVVSLTEQLNRVIDPKPRVTREGAVFRVPPRFIRREKERLPVVADGAKSRSDVGERARLAAKMSKRESLFGGENKDLLGSEEPTKSKDPSKITKGSEIPKDLAVPVDPGFETSSDIIVDEPKSNQAFTDDLLPNMETGKKLDSQAEKLENKILDPKEQSSQGAKDSIVPEDMTVKSPKEILIESGANTSRDDILKDTEESEYLDDEGLSEELSKRIQDKTNVAK